MHHVACSVLQYWCNGTCQKKKKTDTIFKKKPSKNSLPEKCQLKIAQCWMTPVTRILPSASCDAGWIKMVLRRHAFNCTHSWPSYCSIWFTSCSDPVPDCKDGFRSVIWFRLMGPPYFLSVWWLHRVLAARTHPDGCMLLIHDRAIAKATAFK